MFPTHKDCRNFKDGNCILLGIPVDPNKPACPRFIAKNITPQMSLAYHDFSSLHNAKNGMPKVSLIDLRNRLDKAEVKLREIKAMLNNIK